MSNKEIVTPAVFLHTLQKKYPQGVFEVTESGGVRIVSGSDEAGYPLCGKGVVPVNEVHLTAVYAALTSLCTSAGWRIHHGDFGLCELTMYPNKPDTPLVQEVSAGTLLELRKVAEAAIFFVQAEHMYRVGVCLDDRFSVIEENSKTETVVRYEDVKRGRDKFLGLIDLPFTQIGA